MFCVNCGKEINDTAKFCKFCGNNLEIKAESKDHLQSPVMESQSIENVNNIFNPDNKLDNSNTEVQDRKTIIIIVVIVFFVIVLVLIGTSNSSESNKTGWINNTTFSIDKYEPDYCTYQLRNGKEKSVYCYNISQSDLIKIWENTPENFVYNNMSWVCYKPDFDSVDNYVSGMQPLLKKYNLICEPLVYTSENRSRFTVYAIKNGVVKSF